jgi:hypothetical protein
MPNKPKPKAVEVAPWTALRRAGTAGIEAYVTATGQWHTLVEIAPSPHYNNRAAADYITRALGDYPLLLAIIRQAADALDICLESERLTWEAEHDASIAVARARKLT